MVRRRAEWLKERRAEAVPKTDWGEAGPAAGASFLLPGLLPGRHQPNLVRIELAFADEAAAGAKPGSSQQQQGHQNARKFGHGNPPVMPLDDSRRAAVAVARQLG